MVRIGGSTDTGRHIKEHDYYTPAGEFRIDKDGSPTLLNCMMYKMCFYRFGSVYTEQGWLQLFLSSNKPRHFVQALHFLTPSLNFVSKTKVTTRSINLFCLSSSFLMF